MKIMKIMKTSGNGDWMDDSESDGREGVRMTGWIVMERMVAVMIM